MNLRSPSFAFIAFASLALAAQEGAISTRDWKAFSTKDAKFTVKAPKGWGNSDPNDASSKEAMEVIKKNNPNMAKMFENQDNQFALYMYDFSGDATKGLNNLNLKILKDSGLTQAMYPDVAAQVLEMTKLKKSGWKVVDLPAGKTLSYWGELTVALGDNAKMDFKIYGYLTVKDNLTYICTMTTTPEQDKAQKPIFDAMAKTIVLK